jgi:hypothetical protein
MPTKPIDRLMFAQGDLCFFCKHPLPKAEASIEHLVAKARDGSSKDENCVACCKAMNALLGSMSLKEKFQVVLNQKGTFTCPNGNARASNDSDAGSDMPFEAKLGMIVANLKNRNNARPRTINTLTSTIASLFKQNLPEQELSTLIQRLQDSGQISLAGGKVSYLL